MINANNNADSFYTHGKPRVSPLVKPLLSPVPLFILQPALRRIVRTVASHRPELFNRIGPHAGKTFIIDPSNTPFVLVLRPNPASPSLRACRRRNIPDYDARISGTFLTLFHMVDGTLDGDALFFTRRLSIEGDTEAVVCLRNALDDLEGSVIEDAADLYGSAGRVAVQALRKIKQENENG